MSHSERIRLAQELHDGIAQDLVGVGYSLDLLLAAPDTPVATRIDLRTVRFTITDLLEKVRSEIHQLHSGTEKTLSEQIAESAHELCPNFRLNLELHDESGDLKDEVSYGVHQIARELLRNVANHSCAINVGVNLSTSGEELILVIQDDGSGGFGETPHRFGIAGAKSRAEYLGGELLFNSSKAGTVAQLRLPLKNVNRD